MILNTLTYKYSTSSIGNLRKLYNLKCCYRQPLNFLKYKDFPAKSLANRLRYDGNSYKSYKLLSKFYINFLRSNFSKTKNNKYYTNTFNISDNFFFKNTYKQYIAMNDLNRVILWRLLLIQPIFKINISKKKKKKKFYYTSRIKFINEKKRILITWSWLKFFIKSFPNKNQLNMGLENFLLRSPENHTLTDIKYQVYKLQLLRSL